MVARTTLRARFVLATLAALATVLLTLLGGVPPASATEPAARAASDDATTDLSVPLAPDDHGVLQPDSDLALTATIGSDRARQASSVRVGMTTRPLTPETYQSWLSAEASPSQRTVTTTPAGGGMPPLGGTTAHITVPADALSLPDDQSPAVYGVDVAWLDDDGTRVARGRTAVVWAPTTADRTAPVSTVVPITVDAADSGLIPSDELAELTDDDGALTRLISGLEGHPDALIAIDPRILASVRALGAAAPSSAQSWLRQIERLPNDSFVLPYADADTVVQRAAGLDQPLEPTSFDYALDAANFRGDFAVPSTTPSPTVTATATPEPGSVPDADQLLDWPATHASLLWPAATTMDADAVASLDDDATLLLAASDTTANTLTGSTFARVGDHDAVLLNSILSAALSDAVSAYSDRAWNEAMARLSTGLTLAASDSDEPIVIAVERGTVPAGSIRLSQTLSALAALPTVSTAPVAVDGESSAPTVSLTSPGESDERVSAVTKLLDAEKKVDSFADVLTTPSLLTGKTRATTLTLLGSAWLERPEAWQSTVDDQLSSLTALRQSVRIVSGDADYNLMANEGSIPVTVSNPLPYEAEITLHAVPSNNRLAIAKSAHKTVPPQSRAVVLVPVTAQLGNGRVSLTLQLTSSDGTTIGDSAVVQVDVNADWEGIGAAIIGAAAVLLFGFGLVRNIRRRRTATRPRRSDG